MPLTNLKVDKAKPKEKQYKLADERGMYLLIHPKGGKWWRLDYRFQGKRKTLSLGTVPDVSLKEARKKRTGCAISLVGSADWQKLSQIKKLTGRKINREVIEGLEPTSSEPKIEHGAKTNPKFKRKFGGVSKGNGRQKPGHWRKDSSGAKRAKQPRVKKAA